VNAARFLWLIAAVTILGLVSRAPRFEPRRGDAQPLLLRPGLAKTLSKSQFPLLLDAYWLRTLNLIGERETAENRRALYEYGKFLTDSDPRFYHAYKYIGLNVPFQTGRETWVNAELGSSLLRAGVQQFPQDLYLHLYLGFNLFYMEKKYLEASNVFRTGSMLDKAPSWMAPLATRLLSHGGKPRDALALAQEMLADTTDEGLRAELEQRVADLQIEVDLEPVDEAVEKYKAAYAGNLPPNLEALIQGGFYSGPRVDSRGGTISLTENGKVVSSSVERRLKLYGSDTD
jgi:hypothetical protein